MSEFRLKQGMDLPISGAPTQAIRDGIAPKSIGVVGGDYIGLKPKMLVAEGDKVARGTPLFCHKDAPNVMFTAPCKGRVRAIRRGARRVLESVIIDVDDLEDPGVDFGKLNKSAFNADRIKEVLQRSGLWNSFLTRPYSKMPLEYDAPAAIFVTAMESEPLAPDASLVLSAQSDSFVMGVRAIAELTQGRVYVCAAIDGSVPDIVDLPRVENHYFGGPHPSGLAGTHMHFLEAPNSSRTVWSIGYQDVIAIGQLLATGYINPSRVISIAGPLAINPRLVRTVSGASLDELLEGEVRPNIPCRVISGSILSGRNAEGAFAYLGRFARQVSLIKEDTEQIPFGWIRPQPNKFSVMPVLASAFSRSKLFQLTSNLNGGRRAMVPTGVFEALMPQDFLPTQLLRSLLVMDTDAAQSLGALELDEEDLALCTFACPAKYEYGQALRDSLLKIEKEG
jgi:Na+-transporting NADH:ubiquinone oxidoreductase subunit A